MINLRAYHELRDTLSIEQNKRIELQEDRDVWKNEVKRLKREKKTRDLDLKKAKAMLTFVRGKKRMEELLDENQALKEQTESMKQMMNQSLISQNNSDNNQAEESNNDENDSHSSDLIVVLGKLAQKEHQLSAIEQECAAWEKTVVDLKFEIQTLRVEYESQKTSYDGLVSANAKLLSQLSQSKAQCLELEKLLHQHSVERSDVAKNVEDMSIVCRERGERWREADTRAHEAEQLASDLRQKLKTTVQLDQEELSQTQKALDSATVENESLKTELSSCQVALETSQSNLNIALSEVCSLSRTVSIQPRLRQIENYRHKQLISDLRKELQKINN